MLVVEVIPFQSFKERLQLVKSYIGKAKIIIYDTYIYIERIDGEVNDKDHCNSSWNSINSNW